MQTVTENSGTLRSLQLNFVGKIIAGICHDLKNHLAIIKELDGLLADLLHSENHGQVDHCDRYKNISMRIDDLVEQAKEVANVLSGFAHRMDRDSSSFNVHEALSEEIFLLQRFVRQKGLTLELVPSERPINIYNNSALLQFVVFCVLGHAIETLAPEGSMTLSLQPIEAAIRIVIDIKGGKNESAGGDSGEIPPDILAKALNLLQAKITCVSATDNHHQSAITVSNLQ